ncbi:serine hydrolase domain-containing protein [Streptomyces sp. NPDC058665]|uniref:serine hydrolase domain-containing protein n=1 Tax=Streptomyces sp. NPDC058665 TaxID=3346586 RepID=UPI0036512073
MSREMTAAATETETRTDNRTDNGTKTATLTWPRTGAGTGITGAGRHGRRVVVAALLAPALLATAAPAATAREARTGGVQHQLDVLVERDGAPGALAYVNGRTYTAGTAQAGTGRPAVDTDARFRLAGDTKAFTAAAVMGLVADGKVRLDSPARRYVPQLGENPVTVRELLKQRSGLPEYTGLIDWSGGPYTDEDRLALALAADQDFEPGADWAYSNTNYLVLGLLIDNTSGENHRDHIERTVLGPLGLKDTYWPARGEPTPHGLSGPSGGLVSTQSDLNAFWEGLFDGRLLPGWAVRQMTNDTTDVGGRDVYPRGSRYGYGVASIPLSGLRGTVDAALRSGRKGVSQ